RDVVGQLGMGIAGEDLAAFDQGHPLRQGIGTRQRDGRRLAQGLVSRGRVTHQNRGRGLESRRGDHRAPQRERAVDGAGGLGARRLGLGWGATIRTWIAGSKDRSATLAPLPNATTKGRLGGRPYECQLLGTNGRADGLSRGTEDLQGERGTASLPRLFFRLV